MPFPASTNTARLSFRSTRRLRGKTCIPGASKSRRSKSFWRTIPIIAGRTLQNDQPRSDQPYQRMQLVQFNWFLDRGLLSHGEDGLTIDYETYRDAVTSLLAEVLAMQYEGNVAKAADFFERWTRWDPKLHGELARTIRDAQTTRYRLVRYGVER